MHRNGLSTGQNLQNPVFSLRRQSRRNEKTGFWRGLIFCPVVRPFLGKADSVSGEARCRRASPENTEGMLDSCSPGKMISYGCITPKKQPFRTTSRLRKTIEKPGHNFKLPIWSAKIRSPSMAFYVNLRVF